MKTGPVPGIIEIALKLKSVGIFVRGNPRLDLRLQGVHLLPCTSLLESPTSQVVAHDE
jgi:hypothetical protein